MARAQVYDESALRSAVANSAVTEVLIGGSITVTRQDQWGFGIIVNRRVTIRGAGCTTSTFDCTQTISGGGTTQIFQINSGGDVSFRNIKFQNVRPAPPAH